jgi:hypothetical protein
MTIPDKQPVTNKITPPVSSLFFMQFKICLRLLTNGLQIKKAEGINLLHRWESKPRNTNKQHPPPYSGDVALIFLCFFLISTFSMHKKS